MKKYKIKALAKTAVFSSLLFVITVYLTIPTSFGYLNISDAVIIYLASFFPLKSILLISSLSTSVADLFMGYGQYALFTFFIKMSIALTVYLLYQKIKLNYFIVAILAEILMLISYALADVMIFNSWIFFIQSILTNLAQAVGCVIISIVFKVFLRKVNFYGTK